MEKLSLLDFRQRLGLTQQELADRIDVSRNYIALVENGKKPFSDKLKAKLSLVNNSPSAPPREEPRPAACPQCEAKDAEIAWLKRQVEGLVAALAVKPSAAVGRACGADAEGHKEKRGA
jgi:transcriptional regulator with XRE-family HTH domain